MDTAKLFKNGQSQAVRLPKAYRFSGREVAIKRVANAVVLLPLEDPWRVMAEALDEFSQGLKMDRNQPRPQERKKRIGR